METNSTKKVVFLEYNVIRKNWKRSRLRIALCYPNFYKAGMTGLTVQQLYFLLNLDDDVLCERCFLSETPKTIESGAELKAFDVVAFTLQYEEDYVKTIRMLINAGINPLAEKRTEKDPILIAGGQAVSANPLPVSTIFDCIFIGELEPYLTELLEVLKSNRGKKEKLDELSNLKPMYRFGKEKVERCIAFNLDSAPHILAQLTSSSERGLVDPIFPNAFYLEISRSCNRRCRFCLLSWTNGPLRFRSLSKIREILDEGLSKSKANRVVLIGAGIFDVPWLKDVCSEIIARGMTLSMPSLRPDAIDEELLELIGQAGQKSLALGVESFSNTSRMFLGKTYDDDVLEKVVQLAADKGFTEIKVYLITCLPKEDFNESAQLLRRLLKLASKSKLTLHLSVNPLIPKPHTPFQWLPPPEPPVIKESYRNCLRAFKSSRIRLDFLNPYNATYQALVSLGDESFGLRLVELVKQGLESWTAIVRRLPKISLSLDSKTPWDVINVGCDKKLLLKSFEEAMKIVSSC
ncbi:MAG: radical SAM protein [Candidatus Nezhaarchaeales archaeon]